MASQPLDTNSLKKMSWSEYNHFLIIGKIFSLLIERLPFFFDIKITPLLLFIFNSKGYCRHVKKKSQEKISTQSR